MTNDIKLQAEEASICTNAEAKLFKDSFVTDQKTTKDEMEIVIETQVNIEEDVEIIYAMVEEELENIYKIEIEKEAEVSIIQDDDDSEKKK